MRSTYPAPSRVSRSTTANDSPQLERTLCRQRGENGRKVTKFHGLLHDTITGQRFGFVGNSNQRVGYVFEVVKSVNAARERQSKQLMWGWYIVAVGPSASEAELPSSEERTPASM
jgi:hypothetical protein